MAIGGLAHRVDLNLGRILVLEDLVQPDEDIRGLTLSTLGLEAQLLRKVKGLGLAQAVLEVNGSGDDGLGVLSGNLLDVHAALGGRHQYGPTDVAVVQDSDIVLVRGITALCQHDLIVGSRVRPLPTDKYVQGVSYSIADTTGSTCLLRDELRSDHLARIVLGLLRANTR